jgi:predicted transposase YdaD
MPLFDDPPLHDFPDRAIRRLLEDPRNLRDLLMDVAPDLASRFDFSTVEPADRSFLMEDWRRREADLLFRIPFQEGESERPALVCVLVEHQSAPDPRMPLRMLLYAVLYWEREWKAWEDHHEPGEPLSLSPILPVVFHTGADPWRTHRDLAELITGPEALRAFVPNWQPLFWDLAERSPEALLDSAEVWLRALAVVRAEEAEDAPFELIYGQVFKRFEELIGRQEVRRQDLIWFVISWALRRRPGSERERLLAIAIECQTSAKRKREIEAMAKTIEKTWEQELLAEGEARGEARGLVRGRREDLRLVLQQRFGPLAPTVLQRIEAIDDPERLKSCFQQALDAATLAGVDL